MHNSLDCVYSLMPYRALLVYIDLHIICCQSSLECDVSDTPSASAVSTVYHVDINAVCITSSYRLAVRTGHSEVGVQGTVHESWVMDELAVMVGALSRR